jgi:ketosteroid isomerase-like protein
MSTAGDDREAIRDLISNYCYFVDSGEFDRFVDLFTEDSVWESSEFGRYEGKAALHDFISKTPGGLRHLTLNTVITLEGGDARAKSYFVLTNRADNSAAVTIVATAFFEDHIVKRGGRWLFKSRAIHPTAPGSIPG